MEVRGKKMASTILRQDEGGVLSISDVCKSILEERDLFLSDAMVNVSMLTEQVIFSNHIALGYELICALAKVAAYRTKINPKWETKGLNMFRACLSAHCFFESHPEYNHPPDEEALLNPHYTMILTYSRARLSGHDDKFCEGWREYYAERYPHVTFDKSEPHEWRETDDPLVIAYCFYRLILTPKEGMRPSKEACREALQAAQKLYSQPHSHMKKLRPEPGQFRHYHLIPRTLVVSLAIQIEDLETAADILKLATYIDGCVNVRTKDFLIIPGIYDVLPVLAKRGKEGNKYYICDEDAATITHELIQAIDHRLANGRRDHRMKVSWEELLDRLATAAWEVHGRSYRRDGLKTAKDILYPPATEDEITAAEKRVGKLPDDFKEMIRVANGFKGGWQFMCGGIAGIQNIGVGPEISDWVEVLTELGMRDDGKESGNAIIIGPGSPCDGYFNYIIPPDVWKKNAKKRKAKKGRYVFFTAARWSPLQDESEVSDSVMEWIEHIVVGLEGMVAKGEVDEDEDIDEGISEEGESDR